MSAITVNPEQRLFVIKSPTGFSCLGFDVVFRRLTQYAARLGLGTPDIGKVGTLEQYQQYLQTEASYIATKPQETFYELGTAPAVERILERYRGTNDQIRVFLGDPETGRDWLEENDVTGQVRRSWGPIRVPLLCKSGSSGGFVLSTASIVRILDVQSQRELYRHPKYHSPAFTLMPSSHAGYTHDVLVEGVVHARFKSEAKAHDWIAFMRGKRRKP